ncbi:MAG: hypothetical protein ABIQ18_27855 [Umezawaea sp.]
MDISIHFSNGQTLSADDVAIEQNDITLTVHTGPGERTVVPLSAVQFYDVEDSND